MTQGQFKDITATLIGAIPELSFDEAQAVVGDKGSLISGVQEVFERFRIRPEATPSLEPTVQALTVSVPYAGSKTIVKLVKAGRYDWTNENITDRNFPAGDTSGEETVELCLIHFNRVFGSGDEVIRALDAAGFVPAMPAHLLALGVAKPDLQREFPIAALGQVWTDPRGHCHVVCLHEDASERLAYLRWLGRDWPGYWRFLALRK
jgi:hypothetical protein